MQHTSLKDNTSTNMAKYPDTVYPWYLLDIIFFWTANLFIILLLKPDFSLLLRLSFLDFLIFGLGIYGIANITSNAEVTKVIRAPFMDWKMRKDGQIEEVPKMGGFRGFFGSLIYCPRCTGLWWAAVLTQSYMFYPEQVRVVFIIFALSSMERFFTSVIGTFQRYSG